MRPYPRFGANDGNRTHNRSLGSCCFTTKLHSHYSRSLCPGKQDPPLQRLFYHKRAKGQPFLRKLPRSALSGNRSSAPASYFACPLPTRGGGANPHKNCSTTYVPFCQRGRGSPVMASMPVTPPSPVGRDQAPVGSKNAPNKFCTSEGDIRMKNKEEPSRRARRVLLVHKRSPGGL